MRLKSKNTALEVRNEEGSNRRPSEDSVFFQIYDYLGGNITLGLIEGFKRRP